MVNGGGKLDLTDYGNHGYPNDSRSDFDGSLFYAGKVYKHLGAYIEGTYRLNSDTGSDVGYLNKVDLRFANQVDVAGHHVDYGISVNNEPGVQDLWNTNEVWNSYGLDVDRRLSGTVAGATLYAMINNLLYIEAGGYASLPNDVQKGIGRYDYRGYTQMNGAAPYWRIALQHNWDGHYFSIGHFGSQADIARDSTGFSNVGEQHTDLGFGATYQYLANPGHIFELKGSYIRKKWKEINTLFAICLVVALPVNMKQIRNTSM